MLPDTGQSSGRARPALAAESCISGRQGSMWIDVFVAALEPESIGNKSNLASVLTCTTFFVYFYEKISCTR